MNPGLDPEARTLLQCRREPQRVRAAFSWRRRRVAIRDVWVRVDRALVACPRERVHLMSGAADDARQPPPEATFYGFQADGCVSARDAPIVRTLAATALDWCGVA